MGKQRASWVAVCIGLARMILHTRELRRKVLFRLLIALLIVTVLGAWPLADWLASSFWLFLIWWGVCMFYACFVIMLAIYDMAAAIKEERDNHDWD